MERTSVPRSRATGSPDPTMARSVLTGPRHPVEHEAEALADRALSGSGRGRPLHDRTRGRHERDGGLADLPSWAGAVIAERSAPLPRAIRGDMSRRFGHDFSRVRVHAGPRARQSAGLLGAAAFSVGNHVVLGVGGTDLASGRVRRMLAHELAHVVQGPGRPAIRAYRPASAFNFGVADDATLKEDSFTFRADKNTKPWIATVKVGFTKSDTDADGTKYWKGNATASYFANPVKQADFTFPVAGGSRSLGLSDAGTFTVHRIEGDGYNSGTFSGTAGVDYDPAEREGPGKRYTKQSGGFRPSNMSFAVFYNRGEALHAGPIDFSSHGCVHVDWNSIATVKRLNYHSVIDHTTVTVSYPKKP
ncbi:MAG: DUF4157 domain-containing protein [Intrasporangium sp.]|uniref:eCIS core domain-containing protein n=1 Tax=Intrasporangium sp. TaxID=1925024 RepID=UPI00264A288D|nr:DUF4157 domain-containing protein [Intrasporangium sp.]MDN5794377.1 DUF4157 domain-containing protein [Intrasporangium sp.]